MLAKVKSVLQWIGLALIVTITGLLVAFGLKKDDDFIDEDLVKKDAKERVKAARLAAELSVELARKRAKEAVDAAKRTGNFADHLRGDGAGKPRRGPGD